MAKPNPNNKTTKNTSIINNDTSTRFTTTNDNKEAYTRSTSNVSFAYQQPPKPTTPPHPTTRYNQRNTHFSQNLPQQPNADFANVPSIHRAYPSNFDTTKTAQNLGRTIKDPQSQQTEQPSNSYNSYATQPITQHHDTVIRQHNNRNKIIVSIVIFLALAVLIFGGIFLYSALNENKNGGLFPTPPNSNLVISNLRIEKVGSQNEYGKNILKWDSVNGATSYVVTIDDDTSINVPDNEYSIDHLQMGEHTINVTAYNGSNIGLASSITHKSWGTIATSEKYDEGAFGAFDDLSQAESLLGYGFNVIRSNEFSFKEVEISNPIMDREKMKDLQLTKYKHNSTYTETAESDNVETFALQWNAKLNVDVKWWGGSVDIGAGAGGANTSQTRRHFLVFDTIVENYNLALGGGINDYRKRLSEQFLSDLQNTAISPSQLFDLYGTHYINSAVMGGRISSIYYMRTETQNSMLDIAAEIKVGIEDIFNSVGVEGSLNYYQEAARSEIFINSKLRTQGGDNFGIMSDQDIKPNYAAWQKSLETSPTLIGIRNANSLLPIWDMVDPAWDNGSDREFIDINGNATTRRTQLQVYFEKYGLEKWNEMRANYGLPELTPPTDIVDIKIDNREQEPDGFYTVELDTTNQINQRIIPDNALEYSLSYTLDPNTDGYSYASIQDNRLSISDDPNAIGTTLRLTITAGAVYKRVNLLITEFFKVVFDSNGGFFEVAGANPPQIERDNIRSGRNVSVPEAPHPATNMGDGIIFIGWSLAPDSQKLYDIVNTKINRESVPNPSRILIVYAVFSKQKVITVNWVPNGGLFDLGLQGTAPSRSPDIVPNGQLLPSVTITKSDHSFEGWFSDINLTIQFDNTRPLVYDEQDYKNNNITLYAKWSENYKTMTSLPTSGSDWARFMQFNLTSVAGNLEIPTTTDKVIINGSTSTTLALSILVPSRSNHLELTLNNLKIKPASTTNNTPLESKTSNLHLIINGVVTIESHKDSYPAMSLAGGTMSGTGNLTAKGANGVKTTRGVGGSSAIYSSNALSIQMDGVGSVTAVGGNGSVGDDYTGGTWSYRNGGNGGSGMNVIGNLTLAGKITSTGGNGGNATHGPSNGSDNRDHRHGGNGGNAGVGIKASYLTVESGTIIGVGGQGGRGGSGGQGNGGMGNGTNGGHAGSGGNGGNGVEVYSYSGTINTSTKGGNGGDGGKGGNNNGLWGDIGNDGKKGKNGSNIVSGVSNKQIIYDNSIKKYRYSLSIQNQ